MIYIIKMGIAPSIFQMLSFVTNIMMNKALLKYGDLDPVYSLLGARTVRLRHGCGCDDGELYRLSYLRVLTRSASPGYQL